MHGYRKLLLIDRTFTGVALNIFADLNELITCTIAMFNTRSYRLKKSTMLFSLLLHTSFSVAEQPYAGWSFLTSELLLFTIM